MMHSNFRQRKRRLIARSLCSLIALMLALPASPQAQAEDSGVSRRHHCWGRFDEGAWKKVRVVTETLDDEGNVASRSTTDTTSFLDEVREDLYRLHVEVSVELAGKRLDAQPLLVARGFFGEQEGERPIVRNVTAASITLENRKIPCRVYEVEISSDTSKRMTKVYYSPHVAPYILRKETFVTDSTGATTLQESVEAVTALNMPREVLGHVLSTAHVKSVQKNSKGTIVTLAIQSDEVPGGVVAHSSKELDASGRVVRRSTLELTDYGLEPDRRFIRRRSLKRAAQGRRR